MIFVLNLVRVAVLTNSKTFRQFTVYTGRDSRDSGRNSRCIQNFIILNKILNFKESRQVSVVNPINNSVIHTQISHVLLFHRMSEAKFPLSISPVNYLLHCRQRRLTFLQLLILRSYIVSRERPQLGQPQTLWSFEVSFA